MKHGTYVRERDGCCLLYHSPHRWNDATYSLHRYLCGESTSSLSEWRRVQDDETNAVWAYCRLGAGENIEWYGEDYSEPCISST